MTDIEPSRVSSWWTERDELPRMTRSQIADAIWEGRLSIAEAEAADPTLRGLRESLRISDEDAQQRVKLSESSEVTPDTSGYRYADEIEAQLRDEYREHMAGIGIDPDDVGRPWGFTVDEDFEPEPLTAQEIAAEEADYAEACRDSELFVGYSTWELEAMQDEGTEL